MEIAIIVLGLIVVGLIVERYFYSKQMNEELQKCVKAVMSRNINEYISATAADKPSKPFVENDEVLLSEANDDEFDKYIKNETKSV